MDLGWLTPAMVEALSAAAQWLRKQPPLILIAVPIGALLLVQISGLLRRRRRVSRARAIAGSRRETCEGLKEQLRFRLAEPSRLLAEPIMGAPTLGAGKAFEADIEAAAKGVLAEAGGRRAKAKELLRHKAEGNGASNGKLNGSEVGYWRQLGALSLLDSTGDALSAYSRAADLAPNDPEAQMLLGVLCLRAGKLDAAEAAFRRQIRLGEGAKGEAVRYRGYTMLGDVHAARAAYGEAVEAYQNAQHEVLGLLEDDAENADLQRDLSVTCDRIGDALLAKGDTTGALGSFRTSLEIAEVLAERDPRNPGWQRDLSVSLDHIGEVLSKEGDLEGALDCFRRGLAIAERLARQDARPDRQWDLSQSYEHVGDALFGLGKVPEALEHYRDGLVLGSEAVVRDPVNLQWQRDLAASYHKVGMIESGRLNSGEARELLEKGRAIIARLERIASYRAQWRSDLLRFDQALRALE